MECIDATRLMFTDPEDMTRAERASLVLHLDNCAKCIIMFDEVAKLADSIGLELSPDQQQEIDAMAEEDAKDPEHPFHQARRTNQEAEKRFGSQHSSW